MTGTPRGSDLRLPATALVVLPLVSGCSHAPSPPTPGGGALYNTHGPEARVDRPQMGFLVDMSANKVTLESSDPADWKDFDVRLNNPDATGCRAYFNNMGTGAALSGPVVPTGQRVAPGDFLHIETGPNFCDFGLRFIPSDELVNVWSFGPP